MRIIISPAKKMNIDTDTMGRQDLPAFLPCAEQILERLQGMSYEELKALWKCSDKLAQENFERLRGMDLRGESLGSQLTPAILAYEGIQYQYMAPGVFSGEELDYVQEHLRILSGFYGVLRPFDGVMPYRLEMQAKLAMGCVAQEIAAEAGSDSCGESEGKSNASAKDLYGFWGASLADSIADETDCILNLASKEYSVAVSKHLPDSVRFITCVFGEEKNGKIVEKGTLCKMARGEMVRRMAENNVKTPEAVKGLQLLNYEFSEEWSDEETYVFLLKDDAGNN